MSSSRMNGHANSHPLSFSSSSERRPRSQSTTLSSPRMTRLKLRLHALLSTKPLSLLRFSRRSPLYIVLFLLAVFIFTPLPFPLSFLLPSFLLPSGSGSDAHHLTPQEKALAHLSKPKIDQVGNDLPEIQVDIQRSFEEPDYALLSSKQPHQIGCDIPINWKANLDYAPNLMMTGGEKKGMGMGKGKGKGKGKKVEGGGYLGEEDGVLVFLGVFSAAASKEKSVADMRKRRDLYRKTYIPHFPPHLVTIKFILGLPAPVEHYNPAAAIARAKVMRALEEESEREGDMVILDMEDNIDSGKTHKYFQWVAERYAGEGRVKGRPRFVVKSDDDTLLVMPNMISAFRNLNCSQNIYWGTSAGRSQYFGDYFRGLAYGMSWPLISWIGSANMPHAHITKIEDARTGQWLRHLDPVDDPIQRIDMGWTMGDWNQLDVGIETVALHWCKWDDWVQEQHDRILNIWRDSHRPYAWDQGIDPAKSVAKGKRLPEGARRENERQKEMGWDVEGNLMGDGDEKGGKEAEEKGEEEGNMGEIDMKERTDDD